MISEEIENHYPKLRKSEKKVADFMLSHKKKMEKMSLEDVAKGADVSQPTVMRMLKTVGYDSFRQARIAFVEERMTKEKKEVPSGLYGMKVERDDKVEDVPAKVIRNIMNLMQDSLKTISAGSLKKAVELINKADKVSLFSVENSNAIAEDLLTKLMYLGISCNFYEDYYLQSVSAGHMKKGDVAIGISYSGSSKNTVDMLKIAKRSGAATIAITNFTNTPLVEYADVVITTSNQQLLFGNTIFSRTIHAAVVDMIYMGLMVTDYEKYTEQMKKSSRLISERAYVEKSEK